MKVLILTALWSGAALAGEPASVASLQQEVQTLRAQNAQLTRENAELKQQLNDAAMKTVQAEGTEGRQEDKPKNRIRLPSNVTINHNPR